MRYIQRDAAGQIIGHYANEQPYARELVKDDHPDILEFKARAEDNRTFDQRLSDRLQKSVYARGLFRVLAKRFGITEAEIIAEVLAASKGE